MSPGGIRTHNPNKRAAADVRLRARDHWDGQRKSWITQIKWRYLRTVDGNVTKVERNVNTKKWNTVKGRAM